MIPALSQSRFLRFFAFLALYFAQGVPWGFVGVGYPVVMTDQGLSAAEIANVTAAMYAPWTFKILFGPLLDASPLGRLGFGRRRPYVVLAELGMGLTLLYLALLSDLKSHLGVVTAVLVGHNICAALQDVAVDALAVDVLRADERSRANSLMWAAKVAGVAVGGGGGVFLAKYAGWPAVMVTMALIIFAIMLIPLLVREHAVGESASADEARLPSFGDVRASFAFAAPWVGLALAYFGPLGFGMLPSITIRALRKDFAYGEETLGLLNGIVEPVSGALGALLGYAIGDRLGVKRAMAGCTVIIGAMLGMFAASYDAWGNVTYVLVWTALYNGLVYMYQAVSLGLFMTLSNPRIGATHFSLYMAATNFSYVTGAWLSGQLTESFGIVTAYVFAACVQVGSVLLLPLCDVSSAERRFRGGEAPSTGLA